MRTVREAIDACLTLPDAYEDYPFGLDSWAVLRHQTNKKMFASVYEREGHTWINVKTDPGWGDFFRTVYPAVVPAYHMNKLHWISIILDGSMSDDEILHLIDSSYNLTAPKKKKAKPNPPDPADK
ncbi:MAG: MmcQ/YjbR family DNA-binding protein [Eubacteriales bacterium]|nr:MmcQ/YjbR family DNA-binding protein [Eubacteriales bacterium]